MPATKRRSAAERRDELVEIGIRHFAERGYVAASTEAMAADAGISQPYLFRLFGTKRELFLACHEAHHRRIIETFRAAAAAAPEGEELKAMGGAYVELLGDRDQLLFQMQSYAASADPEIRAAVRARYGELVGWVAERSGAPQEDIWKFFATGMLLNVVAALGLEEIAGDEAWAALWCDPSELLAG